MENKLAKPIVAVLSADTSLLSDVIGKLKMHLGDADITGGWHPFVHTSYYAPEMGDGLKRCIVSFERMIAADELPKMKSWTRAVEEAFRVDGRRKVNIDPGYVDYHKVILGSGKGGGHMVLIGGDVFADVLLYYNKGWQPLPWAYPDFKDGTYFEELAEIRKRFKLYLQGLTGTNP